MRLEAGCQLSFETNAAVPAIFMLRPCSNVDQQILSEDCSLQPSVTVHEYQDGYGNWCKRLMVPPGNFQLTTQVQAEVPDTVEVNVKANFVSIENLPDSALQFLLPSRYCQADLLGDLANQIVADYPMGYPQVEAIQNWLHANIKYQYGSSNSSTSALDTAESRVGVCRDFAHLSIALCRSLNIPARMVAGYLYQLKPMDLHAWFEAFVGDRWYTFDATQKELRGNRIAIAYGRDAADVALVTHFGSLTLTQMRVWVNESVPYENLSPVH
ncbi:MAG: transglutaminase family protein [Leptolyngbyaceae cyanobacterium CSU_1_4]|nr:transglutaminase family protein [Leptolyngbyaceae cyanobacterium CSU_1_4]